jgi:hypothetical protein
MRSPPTRLRRSRPRGITRSSTPIGPTGPTDLTCGMVTALSPAQRRPRGGNGSRRAPDPFLTHAACPANTSRAHSRRDGPTLLRRLVNGRWVCDTGRDARHVSEGGPSSMRAYRADLPSLSMGRRSPTRWHRRRRAVRGCRGRWPGSPGSIRRRSARTARRSARLGGGGCPADYPRVGEVTQVRNVDRAPHDCSVDRGPRQNRGRRRGNVWRPRIDFVLNLTRSDSKREYLVGRRGWLDLLGSIPALGSSVHGAVSVGADQPAGVDHPAVAGKNTMQPVDDVLRHRGSTRPSSRSWPV